MPLKLKAWLQGLFAQRADAAVFRKGMAAFALTILFMASMLTFVVAMEQKAPVMTSMLIGCLVMMLVFVFTEEKKTGFWHQSDEAENRVGGMLALIASTAVFLAPDSPLGFIGRDHTILGVVLSVAIAVVVYEYDRYRTRLVMQRRAPHLPRVSSMSLLNVQSGKERLRQLLAALDCLDFSFVGAKLLAQRRIGQAEAEILALLTDAPPDELNYILTNTQLAYLLYKVKDGDVMAVGKTSSSTRTAILELLAIQRLHELEVEARVSLLDAFQKMRLTSHPRAEQWVCNILLNTLGATLVSLKSAFDTRGGAFNLHQLIFRDIRTASIRASIIEHFKTEGKRFLDRNLEETARRAAEEEALASASQQKQQAASSMRRRGSSIFTWDPESDSEPDEDEYSSLYDHIDALPDQPSPQERRDPRGSGFGSASKSAFSPLESGSAPDRSSRGRTRPLRKILSDVDDTLFSSGGKYPAGIDDRFPAHCLYPGVLEFFKELDIGTLQPESETGFWSPLNLGNLVFLSARPHVYKDKSEMKTIAKFEAIRREKGMYQVPALLSGALSSGMKSLSGDYRPLGLQKFANFDEYAQLFPEHKFVFVGDNGQGDVIAAERMFEEYGAQMDACFIHRIQPIEQTPGYGSGSDGGSGGTGREDEEETPARALQRWAEHRIYFFDTYVGAALIAAQHGLVHTSGLRRVALRVFADFLEIAPLTAAPLSSPATVTATATSSPTSSSTSISNSAPTAAATLPPSSSASLLAAAPAISPLTSPSSPPASHSAHHTPLSAESREARRLELNADLAAANALLLDRGLPAVDLLEAERLFADGAYVTCATFSGVARVIDFQPVDALYKLEKMSLDSSSVPSVVFATLRDGMTAASIVGVRVRTHLGSGIVSAARARGAGVGSVAAAFADTPTSPRAFDWAYEIEIDGVLQYLPSRFELIDSQSAKVAAAAASSAAIAATAAAAGAAASVDASKQTTPKKAGWLW